MQEQRLWTPWRMKYVGGGFAEDGCIFCNRLAAENDVESLILLRGENAFVIMNLFPYNTGHVMIVPNKHVADLVDLPDDALSEMGQLSVAVTSAMRRALNPAGFNLGMNIGAVAGAGVADHLHQHVVPRWQGDANFMPILAGAMVMPELIPATYAKIRAELQRPIGEPIPLAIFSRDADHVLLTASNVLPRVDLVRDDSISTTATRLAQSLAPEAGLMGWAGDTRADGTGSVALAYLTPNPSLSSAGTWIDLRPALEQRLSPNDRLVLENALKNDFSIITAPPGTPGEISSETNVLEAHKDSV